MPIYLLQDDVAFPDPSLAGEAGLLAVGGDLSIPRLLLAYRMGIFPWYNQGEPLLWWSPDPRYVLFPDRLHIPQSMRSLLRRPPFRLTLDTAFEAVIRACAGSSLGRAGKGTWITPEMRDAYTALHYEGYAHSVEVWTQEGKLAGGLYGVSLGRCFFGESMFTRVSNASKFGFIRLVQMLAERDFTCIDCQQGTDHVLRFGAEGIPRHAFQALLADLETDSTLKGSWSDWTPGPQ
jgi:leucyl/phenylalanyl-tRNA--protein transferase